MINRSNAHTFRMGPPPCEKLQHCLCQATRWRQTVRITTMLQGSASGDCSGQAEAARRNRYITSRGEQFSLQREMLPVIPAAHRESMGNIRVSVRLAQLVGEERQGSLRWSPEGLPVSAARPSPEDLTDEEAGADRRVGKSCRSDQAGKRWH